MDGVSSPPLSGGDVMAEITRAVILARGLGTRMRRADDGVALEVGQEKAAAVGVKALIPVGRPFLDYVLSSLADAGYTDVCLVIGPEHDALRDRYAREVEVARLRIHFAVQEAPRGTADAVLAVEPFAAGEEFLVVNSDNLYPIAVLRGLRELAGAGLGLFSGQGLVRGGIPAERLRSFAVVLVDSHGFLTDIVEKPDDATFASFGDDPAVSMNCWRLPASIFAACRDVRPSQRGELELPDAVRLAVARGTRFAVVRSDEGVLDLTRRADIAAVTERLRGFPVRL
jgi:glucose-1-phosphate thymidylyltransferase